MAASTVHAFSFAGPAGDLEALWKEPETPRRGSAVIAHAHPAHGGTMHFKVVFRMARALARSGFGVLRFNFRGVGTSQGTHDGGRGEKEDFGAALDEASRKGGTPLLAGGFSFGSVMALTVGAKDARVAAMIGAGVPLKRWSPGAGDPVEKPTLLISGEHDEYGDPRQLEREARGRFRDLRAEIVAGADHFFTGRLDPFEAVVLDFASSLPLPVKG
ncbi:MAG: alpha/beta hydrolase [Thermoanaerobaculia bacterium]